MGYIPTDIPGIWYTELNQSVNKEEYTPICEELAKDRYRVITAKESLKLFDAGELMAKDKVTVIWFHDIESPCENYLSYEMAKIEHEFGLASTHNIRTFSAETEALRKPLFDIEKLGGDIEYQYETLIEAQGDVAKARELFGEHLTELREFFPNISVAFAHGIYNSGLDSSTQFKDENGEWAPELWEAHGIHPKGAFYYFIEVLKKQYQEKFHYIGEPQCLGGSEFVEALSDVNLSNIVLFLQHPIYWSSCVRIDAYKEWRRNSILFK